MKNLGIWGQTGRFRCFASAVLLPPFSPNHPRYERQPRLPRFREIRLKRTGLEVPLLRPINEIGPEIGHALPAVRARALGTVQRNLRLRRQVRKTVHPYIINLGVFKQSGAVRTLENPSRHGFPYLVGQVSHSRFLGGAELFKIEQPGIQGLSWEDFPSRRCCFSARSQ